MSQRERMRSRAGENEPSFSELNFNRRNEDAPNIEMKIERMMLEGFNPSERYRICNSIQNGLESIFREQGVPRTINRSIELASLDGGEFSTVHGTRASMVGNQLAQSVYHRISRIDLDDQFASSNIAKFKASEDRKR